MSQGSLTRRARLARHAVQAAIIQTPAEKTFRVPSRSSPRSHIVSFKWVAQHGEAGYRVTCHYEESVLGQWRCPGNQYGHICWHVLAAFMEASKGPVAFFEERALAEHYANLGGKLCAIWSGDGPGKLYAVVGGSHGKSKTN